MVIETCNMHAITFEYLPLSVFINIMNSHISCICSTKKWLEDLEDFVQEV